MFMHTFLMDIPDPYNGIKFLSKGFLLHCEFYFQSLMDQNSEERKKVRFILSWLIGDDTHLWAEHALMQEHQRLTTVKGFSTLLKGEFAFPKRESPLGNLLGATLLEASAKASPVLHDTSAKASSSVHKFMRVLPRMALYSLAPWRTLLCLWLC